MNHLPYALLLLVLMGCGQETAPKKEAGQADSAGLRVGFELSIQSGEDTATWHKLEDSMGLFVGNPTRIRERIRQELLDSLRSCAPCTVYVPVVSPYKIYSDEPRTVYVHDTVLIAKSDRNWLVLPRFDDSGNALAYSRYTIYPRRQALIGDIPLKRIVKDAMSECPETVYVIDTIIVNWYIDTCWDGQE